jgi:hypothetical protein
MSIAELEAQLRGVNSGIYDLAVFVLIAIFVIGIGIVFQTLWYGVLDKHEEPIKKGLTWFVVIVGVVLMAIGLYIFFVAGIK